MLFYKTDGADRRGSPWLDILKRGTDNVLEYSGTEWPEGRREYKGRDTILIVDDIEVNRIILQSIFEADYNLLEAENGEQAMVLLRQYHRNIAAVLLDLVMPQKDGYQVLAEMNDLDMLAECPVIIITSENSPDNTVKAFDLGASDIVMKPFEPVVVKRRVQNSIALCRNQQNLQERIDEQAARLLESNAVMIDALSAIIEYRSVETGQHIQRIRMFTRELLEEISGSYPELGLDKKKIDVIASASSMHDIGKIAIPDAILNKPGRLTSEEFDIMKNHTTKGCEMLENLDRVGDKEYLQYAYNICRYHHERWDGRGYPDGLYGDNIPICAQVVGIADCYDALTSDRVYKKAIPPAQAMNMILNGECGVFSPKLLECFKNVRDKFETLSNEYRDGKTPKKSDLSAGAAVPARHINGGDSRQMGQQKYLTLLKYVDSTVAEVDFNTGVYHIVYLSSRDFDALKSGTCFEDAFCSFVKEAVHPEDQAMANELLGTYLQDFMDKGFNKRTRRYRVYNRVEQIYHWCQAAMLRINTGNPYQKRALIIWRELGADEGDEPDISTMQMRMYNDAALSHMIGSVQCCLNDSEYTLVESNGGLNQLLGYSRQEIKNKFDSKYLRMIYPADQTRIRAETSKQLESHKSTELEYRLTAKDGRVLWVLEKCQAVSGPQNIEYLVCALMDITATKQAQEELRLSVERHKIIMEQAEDILFEWDIISDTLFCSSKFEKKFGYTPLGHEFSKKVSMVSHIYPSDVAPFIERLEELRNGKPYKEMEFRLSDAQGRYRWCRLRASSQFDANGKSSRVIAVLADVDKQKRTAEALQYQAERDELTQLYNRRTARRLIDTVLDDMEGNGLSALLILDVDNFKQINDNRGHMFGDMVLKNVADILNRQFRADDILSRIGGDEFLIFMNNVPNVETVKKRMSLVLDAIQNMFKEKDLFFRPTCSIGASFYPENAVNFHMLFQQADLAMYTAKGKGKSRCQVYDSSMNLSLAVSDIDII